MKIHKDAFFMYILSINTVDDFVKDCVRNRICISCCCVILLYDMPITHGDNPVSSGAYFHCVSHDDKGLTVLFVERDE